MKTTDEIGIYVSESCASSDSTWVIDYCHVQPGSSATNNIQYIMQTGTTIDIGYVPNAKHVTMDLPRRGLPISVFVSGRLITLGILGTEVECAFTAKQLIFSPGVISAMSYNQKVTISIEYGDETYHYVVDGTSPNSSKLLVRMVSSVKKASKAQGR